MALRLAIQNGSFTSLNDKGSKLLKMYGATLSPDQMVHDS